MWFLWVFAGGGVQQLRKSRCTPARVATKALRAGCLQGLAAIKKTAPLAPITSFLGAWAFLYIGHQIQRGNTPRTLYGEPLQ
ncbi:hypothetical protein C5U62_23085 [Pseudomonas protegens]|uniref:Uncharacterized protein n=1 Tax=Pseudomonas protegens TaxID=380021 RepID=A0A2T6GH65_9PSED|nr:hypothetical protein C5U62_23085 [Pseudomonas protegens]